jgi:6,7-dimethyl-8-ribityllumazine synthase
VPEFSGRLRAVGRVAIIVSRYNELVTAKLLEGARSCCREAGLDAPAVDVV